LSIWEFARPPDLSAERFGSATISACSKRDGRAI
jgi:hypothetical protein